MPRFPAVSQTVSSMTGSVFSTLAHRIATLRGEVHPLHVGDTWLEPAVGARMQDLRVEEHPGMHRYARPHGHPALLEALAERRGVGAERILVTAGATGGLAALTSATVDPGDEVLILAPFWPLIRGIVTERRGVARELPFYDRLRAGRDEAAQRAWVRETIGAAVTERTVALYVNSPSNPTGLVLTEAELAGIADAARAHDLWIWSDEVYDLHAYARAHTSVAASAPERTFSAHSFSKAYGMAGNRCGWLVGPEDPEALYEVRKVSTHTFYSAPTASQIAGAEVLRGGADWVEESRAAYEAAGNAAADRLGLPRPEGGTFLFVDVSGRLDARGLHGFLSDCLDHNLILAPGTACGEAYGGHVRLCFTSAEPDVVARGVDKLAGLLGR